eukprot:gene12402-13559_t
MFTRQQRPTTNNYGNDEFLDSFYNIDVAPSNNVHSPSITPQVAPQVTQPIRSPSVTSPPPIQQPPVTRPSVSEPPRQNQGDDLSNYNANHITEEELDEIVETFGLEKLSPLTDMGFKLKHAWLALRQTKGDVQESISLCIELDEDTLNRLSYQYDQEREKKRKEAAAASPSTTDSREFKEGGKKTGGFFKKIFGGEKRSTSTASNESSTHGAEGRRSPVSSIPSQNPNYVDDNFITQEECFEANLAAALSATEVEDRSQTAVIHRSGETIALPSPVAAGRVGGNPLAHHRRSLPTSLSPKEARKPPAYQENGGKTASEATVHSTIPPPTKIEGKMVAEAIISSTMARPVSMPRPTNYRPPTPPPPPPKPQKKHTPPNVTAENVSSLKPDPPISLGATTGGSADIWGGGNSESPVMKSVAAVVTAFPTLLPTDSDDLEDFVNELSVQVEEDPMQQYQHLLAEQKKELSSNSLNASTTFPSVEVKHTTANISIVGVESEIPDISPSIVQDKAETMKEKEEEQEPSFTATEESKQVLDEEKAPPSEQITLERRSSRMNDFPITILSRGNSLIVDDEIANELEVHEIHELEKAAKGELQLEPFDLSKTDNSNNAFKGTGDLDENGITTEGEVLLEDLNGSEEQEEVLKSDGIIEKELADSPYSSDTEGVPVLHKERSGEISVESEDNSDAVDNSTTVRVVSDHIEGGINPEELSQLLLSVQADDIQNEETQYSTHPEVLLHSVSDQSREIGIADEEDETTSSILDDDTVIAASASNSSANTSSSVLIATADVAIETAPVTTTTSNSAHLPPERVAIRSARIELIDAHHVTIASPPVPNNSDIHSHTGPAAVAAPYLVPFKRRKYLPFQIITRDQKFIGVVSLKQNRLKKGEPSPQGNRPDQVTLGPCATRELCNDLCESMAPPVWASKDEFKDCSICRLKFSMFNKGHHCRNCGYLVCMNCSDKIWPSNMVPITYHSDEKMVRVCHSCHYLTEMFVTALRDGDEVMAKTIYASGNINLYNPFTVYSNYAYAVHCAVSGGNMNLIRWLIDEKKCSLIDRASGSPLVTGNGLTVLAVAAMKGHLDAILYLVHEKKLPVTDISDVNILQRALHLVLSAPGALPPLKPVNLTGKTGNSVKDFMPLEDVVEPLNDTNPGQRRGSQQLPNFRARGIDLQSTAILPLNGITGAIIANPVKNRVLSTHATIGVNQFVERQRLASFTSQLPPTSQNNNIGSASPNAISPNSPVNGRIVGTVASPSNSPQVHQTNRNQQLPPPHRNHNQHQPQNNHRQTAAAPVTTPAPAPAPVPAAAPRTVVPHIQQRIMSIASADIVTADLLQPGTIVSVNDDDVPVEAEAFLADDVVFTITPN